LNDSITQIDALQTCNTWLYMPSSAINRRRYFVLGLSVWPSVII